jgi:hypothetical protein
MRRYSLILNELSPPTHPIITVSWKREIYKHFGSLPPLTRYNGKSVMGNKVGKENLYLNTKLYEILSK